MPREDRKAKQGSTLCKDIVPLVYGGDVTLPKTPGVQGLRTFKDFLDKDANDWCAAGLCGANTCKGTYENLIVTLLSETETTWTYRFSTKIFCHCG